MRLLLLIFCYSSFGSLGAFAIEYDASKAMVVKVNNRSDKEICSDFYDKYKNQLNESLKLAKHYAKMSTEEFKRNETEFAEFFGMRASGSRTAVRDLKRTISHYINAISSKEKWETFKKSRSDQECRESYSVGCFDAFFRGVDTMRKKHPLLSIENMTKGQFVLRCKLSKFDSKISTVGYELIEPVTNVLFEYRIFDKIRSRVDVNNGYYFLVTLPRD